MHEPSGPVTFHFYRDEAKVNLEIGPGGGEGTVYTLEREIAKTMLQNLIHQGNLQGNLEITFRPHSHPFFKTKK